jgi:hypothetical protein
MGDTGVERSRPRLVNTIYGASQVDSTFHAIALQYLVKWYGLAFPCPNIFKPFLGQGDVLSALNGSHWTRSSFNV